MLGPGLLAGLSDDDPAGITTYSVLGAEYGYQLLWVLTLSTVALIVFHEIAMRLGVVTGKGLQTLMRERFGSRTARLMLAVLVVANTGTLCAEFAGVAAGMNLLAGTSAYVSVPVAAVAVGFLVLRGGFRRIEHALLALSAVFLTYLVAGFIAGPDWGAAAKGAVVPTMPLDRDAIYIAVATLGTTLAPWGLAFMQSYAVDKGIEPKDLRYERVDVLVGAVLTGVIGAFIVVTCAATLHAQGITINDASDAAAALEPVAGSLAKSLFGVGIVSAAILAAAIVPLSTAYSISETFGKKSDLDDSFGEARPFYLGFGAVMFLAVAITLIPGMPLVTLLVATQVLNAVLLLVLLPFLRRLASDRALMGDHSLSGTGRALSGIALLLVACSVVTLGVLVLS